MKDFFQRIFRFGEVGAAIVIACVAYAAMGRYFPFMNDNTRLVLSVLVGVVINDSMQYRTAVGVMRSLLEFAFFLVLICVAWAVTEAIWPTMSPTFRVILCALGARYIRGWILGGRGRSAQATCGDSLIK